MDSETKKQTLLHLGDEKIEGTVTDRTYEERHIGITIKLDVENTVKCLDFLASIGLLEKKTING